jgi:hypothetical protein
MDLEHIDRWQVATVLTFHEYRFLTIAWEQIYATTIFPFQSKVVGSFPRLCTSGSYVHLTAPF